MELTLHEEKTLTKEDLACISLFFYLCKSPVRAALAAFMHLPGIVNTGLSIVLIYLPLVFMPIVSGEKRKIADFIVLWCVLLSACMVTYAVHPEYEEWLFHGEFNIWLSIFRPDQPIYIYLFIRLIDNSEKLFTALKYSALALFLYDAARFVYAEMVVGYWEGTGISRGTEGEYNLGFGYEVLFLFIIFMVIARYKNKLFYAPALVALMFILIAGSRGPLVGVGLIMILLAADAVKKLPMAYRYLIIILVCLSAVILINYYDVILMGSATFLNNLGISSRTITKILSGEITEDNGRLRLYEIAIDLIRTGGPFGNGIYGDRYVISSVTKMWIGYCHNVVLEILVDYGYLLGTAILLLMARKIIRILFSEDSEWRSLYIIFLISCSQLLLSGSYLYSFVFWGCLATGVCWAERYEKIPLKLQWES